MEYRLYKNLKYAEHLIKKSTPLYNINYTLGVLDHDIKNLPEYCRPFHIVNAYTARDLISNDNMVHPSKRRQAQITDLTQMITHGLNGYYVWYIIRDNAWGSIYPRVTCRPAEYQDVMNVINYIVDSRKREKLARQRVKKLAKMEVVQHRYEKVKHAFDKNRIKNNEPITLPF